MGSLSGWPFTWRPAVRAVQALDATRARYQKEHLSLVARGQAASLPEARRMLLKWFAPMTAAIQREQQRVGAICGGAGHVRSLRSLMLTARCLLL